MDLPTMITLFKQKWFMPYPKLGPDVTFTGQTVLVTGATSGLGYDAARQYVERDAERVFITARTLAKGEEAKKRIERETKRAGVVHVLELQYGDYKSINAFKAKAEQEIGVLDIALLNAGVFMSQFKKDSITHHEQTIQINTISTAAVALAVLPLLQKSTLKPFLTIVGSSSHIHVKDFSEQSAENLIEALDTPGYNGVKFDGAERYAVSKVLVQLVTQELQKIAGDKVTVNAVCPGGCKSDIGRDFDNPVMKIALVVMLNLFMKPTEVGGRQLLAASQWPKSNGAFIYTSKINEPTPLIGGKEGARIQAQLWKEITAELKGNIDVEI